MKSLSVITLIAIIVSGFMLASTITFSYAQTGTNVSGIISQDTTWTKANSPYTLTGPVVVAQDVTLTIEPGVTVSIERYLLVNGTLRARGTSTDPIYIYGRPAGDGYAPYGIDFVSVGNGWNEQTDSGSIIENAIISAVITGNNVVKISNNTITGLIGPTAAIIINNTINGQISASNFAVLSNNTILGGVTARGGSPVIANNTITGGIKGNGIAFESTNSITISGNTISGCTYGISAAGWGIIENNLIINNQYGIAVGGGVTIQNNTITNNYIGLQQAPEGEPITTIHHNNFQNNSGYNLYLARYETNNVNASYNWWGTTNTQTINQTIYDNKNDYNLGTVNFVPFLTEPNPQAMSYDSSIILPASSLAPSSTPSSSPTPTTTIMSPSQPPSSMPSATLSPSPSQNLTTSPNQSSTQTTLQVGLYEIIIAMLIGIIGVLLIVIVAIRRRSKTKNPS